MGAVADAALNIRNALRELWPGIIIGVCFFHCKKALHTNKGKFVSDENYKKFCADVDLLHTVTKPEIFVVGLELLLRRWRSDFSLLVLQPWSLLSPALTQLWGRAQLWLKEYCHLVLRPATGFTTFLVPSQHASPVFCNPTTSPARRLQIAVAWRDLQISTRGQAVRSFVRRHLQFYELEPVNSLQAHRWGPLCFFKCSCVYA